MKHLCTALAPLGLQAAELAEPLQPQFQRPDWQPRRSGRRDLLLAVQLHENPVLKLVVDLRAREPERLGVLRPEHQERLRAT
eukprot:CAMPEP_0179015460 /NCGR_PEP_ID=MMETSP0796-20121207/2801_1 /TAXON_ID=73915 /ORGANISM="Pyrodinium bahamense, Strain pbaha01" /LENGTH=81 /DNA_ID=CAMNT_0020711091 /DNA_START=145 /DNA_END=390 /DNA_ORIENTATION=-